MQKYASKNYHVENKLVRRRCHYSWADMHQHVINMQSIDQTCGGFSCSFVDDIARDIILLIIEVHLPAWPPF